MHLYQSYLVTVATETSVELANKQGKQSHLWKSNDKG